MPVRVDVLKERELSKRWRIPWTPTFVFVDGSGLEHHRFIGYLPPDEFLAQVHLAGAREAFGSGRHEEALKRYGALVERFPESDAAPESLYWTGVCEFKLTKDVGRIAEKNREVLKRYPNHIWAKKLAFAR